MLRVNSAWPGNWVYFMLYNVLKTSVAAILLYLIAIGTFAREKYIQEALQGQYNSLNSQMLFPCEIQG